MIRPFDLDEWLKDKNRKVVDTDGEPIEIVAIPVAAQFYKFVPKEVDPTTCVTYHSHKKGSNCYPVLCRGPYKTLFFAEG